MGGSFFQRKRNLASALIGLRLEAIRVREVEHSKWGSVAMATWRPPRSTCFFSIGATFELLRNGFVSSRCHLFSLHLIYFSSYIDLLFLIIIEAHFDLRSSKQNLFTTNCSFLINF